MTSTDSAGATALAAPPFSIPDVLVSASDRNHGAKIIQRRFKIPNLMAELLYELLIDELKSSEELLAVGIQHPQLSIQRLRKMLKITIHARRFTGYWIDPDDRQRLVATLES
jgi:hypothetical protein